MLTYQSPGVSEFDLLTDTPASYAGHGGKVVVVTGAETGLTFTDAPTFSSITIADGGTIGQAAGPLLTFDDTLNYLEITGCKVIIGGTIPLGTLHVRTAASGALAPSGFADEFIIEGTGSMGMTFMANGGGAANIYFADDGSNQDASIGYNFSARTLSLAVLNGAHMLMYPGEFVINELSYDVNFRVESDGNINMLYVDGGTNGVGIGKIPTDTFDVAGNIVLSGTVDGVDVAGANAAQYVCIALDGNLANERVLTGTGNQVTITDNGAGGTVVISLPNDLIIPGTITIPNTGLHILDTGGDHDLIIVPGTDLSADRILTFTTGDAARTVTLTGNPTLDDWFDQSVKVAASPTFADVYIPDGGTFGISGNELLTFNAAGTAVFSGCMVGIGGVPTGSLDISVVPATQSAGMLRLHHPSDPNGTSNVMMLQRFHWNSSNAAWIGFIDAAAYGGGNDWWFNNERAAGSKTVFAFNGTGKLFVTDAVFRSEIPLKIKEAAAAVADTVAYGQIWIKDDAPCAFRYTDDAGNEVISISNSRLQHSGAISSATLVLSAAGPTDNLDVSGVNTIFIDTSLNNVILGGTVGGVDGQILCIVVHDPTNDTTIENIEGTGNQDFYLHAGGDETLTSEYGGWIFVNDGGGHWHDASHAKHV